MSAAASDTNGPFLPGEDGPFCLRAAFFGKDSKRSKDPPPEGVLRMKTRRFFSFS